jgi:DNA modification methylase
MEDFSLYGKNLFGEKVVPKGNGIIQDKFTFAPFSVLSARDGIWQERKKRWMGCGIESELGRDAESYSLNGAAVQKYDYLPKIESGTSIFDPVLTELMYQWFTPKGGQIVDPFSGGSVRGVVASLLGYKYWGCDLRKEQIEANIKQGADICDNHPEWVCGDSMETLDTAPDADFIFSCPPYGDLEKYSDDPADISNMEYHTFKNAYKRIILRACKKLKNNRFACFVVGDFRDKKGHYRNFVSDTIEAFREQRLELYNEAILLTPTGSLPIRITKQFEAGRKLGKTHQNILIFVKGSWKEAVKHINKCASE